MFVVKHSVAQIAMLHNSGKFPLTVIRKHLVRRNLWLDTIFVHFKQLGLLLSGVIFFFFLNYATTFFE